MALDLRLEHVGGGKFQTLGRLDFDLCCQQLVPGEKVRAKVTKKRSVRQNNLFHALIQAAYDNQRGGPVLPTWEHLKAWLLIDAGHCDEYRINVRGMPEAAAVTIAKSFSAILKQKYDEVAISYDRGRHEIIMRFARSVSFAATDADQMKPVMDRVLAAICTDIVPGMDPETILNMARKAA